MNLGKGSTNLRKIDLTSRDSILSQFDQNVLLKLTDTQTDFIVEMLFENPETSLKKKRIGSVTGGSLISSGHSSHSEHDDRLGDTYKPEDGRHHIGGFGGGLDFNKIDENDEVKNRSHSVPYRAGQESPYGGNRILPVVIDLESSV